MRSRSFMLIMISLGCGAIAAVGMLQVLSQKSPQVKVEKKLPVLVAQGDLNIKDELTPENVRIEYFPETLVPEGVVTSWDAAQGKKIMARVHRGMPIMAATLFDKHQISDVVVPEGYKVFPIKVDTQNSFVGLLNPGDRIDVISIHKIEGEDRAKTFLKNVQVYAVGNKTDRIPDPEGMPKSVSTVQLVVNQVQAERLALYEQMGSIRFVMGSDENATEPILVDDETLEAEVEEVVVTPAPAQVTPEGQAVGIMLKNAATGIASMFDQARKAREASARLEAQKRPHVMIFMTNDGAETKYEWPDVGQSPNITTLSLPTSKTNASNQNRANRYKDSNKAIGAAERSTSVDYDDEDADY
jgi:Flp pilus assembly protein CpaB